MPNPCEQMEKLRIMHQEIRILRCNDLIFSRFFSSIHKRQFFFVVPHKRQFLLSVLIIGFLIRFLPPQINLDLLCLPWVACDFFCVLSFYYIFLRYCLDFDRNHQWHFTTDQSDRSLLFCCCEWHVYAKNQFYSYGIWIHP